MRNEGRGLSRALFRHTSSTYLNGRRGWDIATLRRPLVMVMPADVDFDVALNLFSLEHLVPLCWIAVETLGSL